MAHARELNINGLKWFKFEWFEINYLPTETLVEFVLSPYASIFEKHAHPGSHRYNFVFIAFWYLLVSQTKESIVYTYQSTFRFTREVIKIKNIKLSQFVSDARKWEQEQVKDLIFVFVFQNYIDATAELRSQFDKQRLEKYDTNKIK